MYDIFLIQTRVFFCKYFSSRSFYPNKPSFGNNRFDLYIIGQTPCNHYPHAHTHAHTHIHTHTHYLTHTHTHAGTYTYSCTYTRTHIHTNTRIHTQTHTLTHVHSANKMLFPHCKSRIIFTSDFLYDLSIWSLICKKKEFSN